MAEQKTNVEILNGILKEFGEDDIRTVVKRIGIMTEKQEIITKEQATITKEWTDPFSFLGKGAPIFRAIFAGVQFPIKDREELISKAGGKERLIVVSDSASGEIVYSLLDLLDAFPEIEKLFPMKSAMDLVKKFAAIEVRRKREHKTSPLLRIGGKHMAELNRERPLPVQEPKAIMQLAGLADETATGATLLSTLAKKEGLEILQGMPADTYKAMVQWVEWVVQTIIDYHRNAALAAAASAEQQANAAEAAANAAQNATQNVGAAGTNEQAQQAVDQACSAAAQAANAAQQAANAAASACAHAGAVPSVIEAQTACSNAQTASARASAAATRAQGACQRARDIASISIVTICGHVNEEDPCCDDDVNGANIEVCNVNYPEIPCGTASTDGNGNYCVTGRFGHSSRVGCANVRVTMNSGPSWGNISQSKQITICNHSPSNVNFSFDAPGVE